MALSKSTEANNKEFVVHVRGEYDYRFICELRDDMFDQIKACYFHLMNENLPVYGVPGKLKQHRTSKNDAKAGLDKIPPDSFRLRAEDDYEPLTDTPASATSSTAPDEDDELPTAGNHRPSFCNPKVDANVTLSDFVIKSVIGRGSFGKVFLVQKRGTNNVYAMKSLRKDVIIEYDQVESTRLEKDILLQADHPFLVGMSYVFQTEQKIFFVMRFVRGGELFMHLRQVTRFPEERARFYAIQVAMALGHLHSKNIIYRDLKPENILMDEDGYICLTDFGLAKVLEGNAQAFSFCGTPDYLAPEILVERGHSFPVDWWALGILTYEMIVGFPPFYTGTQNNSKMYELIKKKAVYFPDPQRHNIMMSENCKNFITRVSHTQSIQQNLIAICVLIAPGEKPSKQTWVAWRPRRSACTPMVRRARSREGTRQAYRGAREAHTLRRHLRCDQLRQYFHLGGRSSVSSTCRENAHHPE